MIVLRVGLASRVVNVGMILGSIVRLAVSCTRMRAFLLDEDAFEGCPCATICDHHLLRIVQNLLVIHATGARVLLLSLVEIFQLCLLVCHVRLSLMVDTLRAFHSISFIVGSRSINGRCHCSARLILAFDGARTPLSL